MGIASLRPSYDPLCRFRFAFNAEATRLTGGRPSKPATSFVVAIQVEALDRQKLLGDIATVLAESHVNILSATSQVGKDRISKQQFTFELADITHLSRILASVKGIENVIDAFRVVPR